MLHPLVVLIGPADSFEFAPLRDWLSAHTRLVAAENLTAAREHVLDGRHPPQLVLLLQSRTGEHAEEEIGLLRSTAPLARWNVVLGSWCEGETRSGRPLTGIGRWFWHEALSRVRREMAELAPALFGTVGEQASHLGGHSLRIFTGRSERTPGLLAIAASRLADYEALADLCSAGGWGTSWIRPHGVSAIAHPAAILWDGIGATPNELRRLTALREAYPETPLAALLHFPRWQEVEQLESLGIAWVLGKPFTAEDLLTRLAEFRPVCQAEVCRRAA